MPAEIDGLYNFRDTGGLPLTDGGSSKPGVLFRSDALNGLTPAGLTALAATDIGVIVDFRTPEERQSAPDRLPTSRPLQVVDLSILEGAMADMAARFLGPDASADPEAIAQAMAAIPTLGDMYVGMLQHGASAFAQVARLISVSRDDAPTAVLVHCTAGKDRTGVATALMLDAAGVERSAVVADYASSQENLAGPWAGGMLHMIASFGIPVTPELRTLATGTPPAAIEQALAWTDAGFGGAAGYLLSGGLTEDELAAMRERLAG
ncbi:tyrosine-protein phosphatase [Microbacterium caowuchunii]|uniref:Tyrosine-protein phosphatase n=1 Tax=Microbacterium caowuchunii TaxID=2614638 RepID=A0A5N0TFV1_9MICO|nr:tyrosine-protein phosphatase [Microbacterium caowuchunii]KAA9132997.1 tyrosine-protein phosphatase [Microbacterium caowuchunii]